MLVLENTSIHQSSSWALTVLVSDELVQVDMGVNPVSTLSP